MRERRQPVSHLRGVVIAPLNGMNLGDAFLCLINQLSPGLLGIEEAREIFRRRLAKGWLTIVAYHREKMVGTASCLIEQKFIHNGGKLMHVEDVVVDGRYRGQDIGSKLMRHLERLAKGEECYRIVLNCSPDVLGFYVRQKYVQHGLEMRRNLTARNWRN